MAVTKQDIRDWLERAKAKGATHLIVACDTFDWDDYPVFVMPNEDARKKAEEHNGPNMTKLMEVYKLDMDWDQQLNQHRSFNY